MTTVDLPRLSATHSLSCDTIYVDGILQTDVRPLLVHVCSTLAMSGSVQRKDFFSGTTWTTNRTTLDEYVTATTMGTNILDPRDGTALSPAFTAAVQFNKRCFVSLTLGLSDKNESDNVRYYVAAQQFTDNTSAATGNIERVWATRDYAGTELRREHIYAEFVAEPGNCLAAYAETDGNSGSVYGELTMEIRDCTALSSASSYA